MTCALGASIIFLWLSLTGPPPPLAHHTYLPEVEAKPRFLLGNVSYRHFDDEAELLWRDLVPSNNGAVLATNITTGFHFWAIPAMFHQLRCLREIRHEFIALSRSGAEARRFMSDRGPGSSYANVSYCFDYVRQVRLKCTPSEKKMTNLLISVSRAFFVTLIPLCIPSRSSRRSRKSLTEMRYGTCVRMIQSYTSGHRRLECPTG